MTATTGYDELIRVLGSLPVLVAEKRRRDGLSLRDAAAESGLAANTILRTERGDPCSQAGIVMLLRWLDGRPVSPRERDILRGRGGPA